MTQTENNTIKLTKEQAEQMADKYHDFIPSNAPELTKLYTGGAEKCPHCGKETPWLGALIGNTIFWTATKRHCTCPEAVAEEEAETARIEQEKEERQAREKAERIERMQHRAGMGSRERRKTFSDLEQTPDNYAAIMAAKKYAQSYINRETRRKPSLFICGDLGTGKTHLAAAMANEIIENGRPVKYATFTQMTQEIRAAFYSESKETEAETVRKYKTAALLFLDDLGKEKATEWSLAKLFELIDSRYSNGLPTVITSNYTLDQLADRLTPPGSDKTTAEAIIDRLWEDCQQVQINGQSWRRR